MRGYFGIGVEGISKPMNVGSLFRTAHAFGADFVFALAPAVNVKELYSSDTSQTAEHVPLHVYDNAEALKLPKGCALVGIELSDDAIELPSFSHPPRAAYVFGPERAGGLRVRAGTGITVAGTGRTVFSTCPNSDTFFHKRWRCRRDCNVRSANDAGPVCFPPAACGRSHRGPGAACPR